MSLLRDAAPDVDVQLPEYIRLLGYPRGWELRDRARELADWARDWYATHGRPWIYAREAESLAIAGQSVLIDGVPFTSARLVKTLQDAGAHGAVLVAVGAGPELERQAHQLWAEEKPDEYFFLEVYGSAVVEHLVTMAGARLCAWAEGSRMAVLPHYSPGYPAWSIDEQARLLEVINRHSEGAPVPVEVLDSGMLRPKKSLLAVFGVTRHADRVARLTDLVPCENCSFASCQYRRVPYRRAPQAANPELAAFAGVETRAGAAEQPTPDTGPLDRNASYTVNQKALKRWSDERLALERRDDGSVAAVFRYEGTTCTNMGRPLEFRYQVTLGPRAEGYPIREQECRPADGDRGHRSMCRYLSNREQLMSAIAGERPLHGHQLNDIVGWERPSCATGCYCEPAGRQHKWGLVLETIHYALAHEGE